MRAQKRIKDGKKHRYWSIVENQRTNSGKVCQRQALYRPVACGRRPRPVRIGITRRWCARSPMRWAIAV